ncbi:lysozyme C-like [Betta splendens]|uniref:lysozyme n=1 Tax=Betta splendens TaxID=158456 RepID=A0A6P7NNS2_BETSP|nr:lysozyme C-like [Betta splendens]
MKVLQVLLLAALGCSLQVQGRILAKCDLRNQLAVAVGNMTWPGREGTLLNADDVVAQLVCLAEKGAHFDTGALTELAGGQLDQEHTGEGQPHEWRNRENCTLRTPQPWMLYGIFQLSNGLSCNDSANATHNVCDLACSKLIDDDISDDISCLLMFFKNLANNGIPPPPFDTMRRVRLLFRKQCTGLIATDYFAGCPPPPN